MMGEGYHGCVVRWVVVARLWLSLWHQSATSASIVVGKLEESSLDPFFVKVLGESRWVTHQLAFWTRRRFIRKTLG
jgi:hypothetical protein